MKRSEINKAIRAMEAMIQEHRFELPPFCGWTPEEWQDKNHEYDDSLGRRIYSNLHTNRLDGRIA